MKTYLLFISLTLLFASTIEAYSLIDLLRDQGLTELKKRLEETGLNKTLVGPGPFTIFGPNNNAFHGGGEEEDTASLKAALLYHVLGDKYKTKDLQNGAYTTLNGLNLFYAHYQHTNRTLVNGVNVIQVDLVADNGILHVIDTVLDPPKASVLQAAEASPELKILSEAIMKAPKVAQILGSPGNLTVFAPTNEAFWFLPHELVKNVAKDENLLTQVLLFHTVSNNVLFSGGMYNGLEVETLAKKSLNFSASSRGVWVNGHSKIIKGDLVQTNGVVHLISKVLSPFNLEEINNMIQNSQLIEFLKSTDLYSMLSDEKNHITLFGPSDAAFYSLPPEFIRELKNNKTLLEEVLKYHIVSDPRFEGCFQNDELITTLGGGVIRINRYGHTLAANGVRLHGVAATNGFHYQIEKVLFPAKHSIGHTVDVNEHFKILKKGLKRTGLESLFADPGNYTVFAPNDNAFKKIGINEWTIEKIPEGLLRSILKYHVLHSTYYEVGLKTGKYPTMLEGKNIYVVHAKDHVKINLYVSIKHADLSHTNGVVHVVDNVLIPSPFNLE